MNMQTLRRPYATSFGGYAYSTILLLVIGVWNGVSSMKMISCRNATSEHKYPNHVSSAYGKIAYSGLGQAGVFLIDFSIFITLIGVCISSQINFGTLLNALPYRMPSTYALIWISMIALAPLSCVKDIQLLSNLSPAGLGAILLCVVAIFAFGVFMYGSDFVESLDADVYGPSPLHLWPLSVADGTQYFGVVTFCYGVCAIAFPVEESMMYPEKFPQAILQCMLFVCVLYLVVGAGAGLLFSYGDNGISDNILLNLPDNSIAATTARIMMALVCVVTYPLTLFPPAQLLESFCVHWLVRAGAVSTVHTEVHTKLSMRKQQYTQSIWVKHKFGYDPIATDIEDTKHEIEMVMSQSQENLCERGGTPLPSPIRKELSSDVEELPAGEWEGVNDLIVELEPSILLRCILRVLLVAMTTLAAASVPCFGLIIETLGSFTISISSFIMPSLLHLLLCSYPRLRKERGLQPDNFGGGEHCAINGSKSGFIINDYAAVAGEDQGGIDSESKQMPAPAIEHLDKEENSQSRNLMSPLKYCQFECCVDALLTLVGLVACVIGTSLSAKKIVEKIINR